VIVQTPVIVLKSFPYGDNSLIARCFTKEQGKLSLIIKGARNKKSPKGAHFEPMSYIDVIYNYNSNRELHIVSKVSFIKYWSNILNNLRSITLSLAILDLTEKTLSYEDPHPNLFSTLKKVLTAYNKNNIDPNILFWFYECSLLNNLGFRPNLNKPEFPGLKLPNIRKANTSGLVLARLLSGDIEKINTSIIKKEDRRIISDYLWMLLCYHFDNLNKVKFKKVIKTILSE